MKKLILLISILFMIISCAMTQEPEYISIGELTPITVKAGTDVFAIEQSDSTRKISLATLMTDIIAFGTITIGDATISEPELEILDDALFSTTEGNYLVGVTSAIQTQINTKLGWSDTTAMLIPYIHRGDTAAMLAPYIMASELPSTYLAISDTSAMLQNYIHIASNGLTETAQTVKLGGTLTENTNINTTGSYDFKVRSFDNTYYGGAVKVSGDGSSSLEYVASDHDHDILVSNGGIQISVENSSGTLENTLIFAPAGGITLTDNISSKGIVYNADYSTNWTDHSLVTKKWVTDNFSSPDSSWALINLQPISTPGTSNEGDMYYDTEDDSLYLRVNTSWVGLNRTGGGGSMVYPGQGIAVSDVTSWSTSITNSEGLRGALSDETGTGVAVFGTAPTFTTSITIGNDILTEGDAELLKTITGSDVQTQINSKLTTTDTTAMITPYIREAEVVAAYAPLSSPTFTGTVTIPTPFTLGATSVTANGTELNVLDNMVTSTTRLNYLSSAGGITGTSSSNIVFSASPTFTGTTLMGSINTGGGGIVSKWAITPDDGICALDAANDTLYYHNPLSVEVDMDTIAYMLVDTIPLYGAVLGVGNTNDTLAFTLNNKIWAQYVDGSHDLVITKVWAVAQGTTPDIDIALLYASDYSSGSPTAVMTSDLTVNSTSTGNSTTTFSNATISPGNWLYLRVDQADTKPTQLIVSIFGYREEN